MCSNKSEKKIFQKKVTHDPANLSGIILRLCGMRISLTYLKLCKETKKLLFGSKLPTNSHLVKERCFIYVQTQKPFFLMLVSCYHNVIAQLKNEVFYV